MQRALVSVDDLTQTLTRIIDLANAAMNAEDSVTVAPDGRARVSLTEEERHHALALARGAISGAGTKDVPIPCPLCTTLAEKFARVATGETLPHLRRIAGEAEDALERAETGDE